MYLNESTTTFSPEEFLRLILHDAIFGNAIQGAGGLDQNQHTRIVVEGSGYANTLALTAGELHAPTRRPESPGHWATRPGAHPGGADSRRGVPFAGAVHPRNTCGSPCRRGGDRQLQRCLRIGLIIQPIENLRNQRTQAKKGNSWRPAFSENSAARARAEAVLSISGLAARPDMRFIRFMIKTYKTSS